MTDRLLSLFIFHYQKIFLVAAPQGLIGLLSQDRLIHLSLCFYVPFYSFVIQFINQTIATAGRAAGGLFKGLRAKQKWIHVFFKPRLKGVNVHSD